MAYEHNDIATKNRLMSGLGEEIMGFEHNDIVTVDVMEKAIAAGGGGGDLTTAQVTTVGDPPIDLIICDDAEGQTGITYVGVPGSGTYSVPLYKGVAHAFPNDGSIDDFSVTGSIEIDAENTTIIITGDGTITYSPS